MSLLGFDKIIKKTESAEKNALRRMMRESQKEFAKNFADEVNSETGDSWEETVRPNPPKILDVTGKMKRITLAASSVTYTKRSAVLLIDPTDSRGRNYADFHQQAGSGTYGKNVQREFITESAGLGKKMDDIMYNELDRAFQ